MGLQSFKNLPFIFRITISSWATSWLEVAVLACVVKSNYILHFLGVLPPGSNAFRLPPLGPAENAVVAKSNLPSSALGRKIIGALRSSNMADFSNLTAQQVGEAMVHLQAEQDRLNAMTASLAQQPQAIQAEPKREYKDIRTFFAKKAPQELKVEPKPEIETGVGAQSASTGAVNGGMISLEELRARLAPTQVSPNPAPSEKEVIAILLQKVNALGNQLAVAQKKKTHGVGAEFPPAPNGEGKRFFYIPKGLCRGTIDANIACGESAAKELLKHGTPFPNPLIIGYEALDEAVSGFSFVHDETKKTIAPIRR